MFIFPDDFHSPWTKNKTPPAPSTRTFVLTQQSGAYLYGCSIAFYDHKSHAKAICLLSQWPMAPQFQIYLTQLFKIHVPLSEFPKTYQQECEQSLWTLFHHTPVPSRAAARIIVGHSRPFHFTRPSVYDCPGESDLDELRETLALLPASVLVQCFHHLLLEHSMVLISTDATRLMASCQTLRTLLFPIQWMHVYIPVVPAELDVENLLQAPVPLITGILPTQVPSSWHNSSSRCLITLDIDSGVLSVPSKGPLNLNLPTLPPEAQTWEAKLDRISGLSPSSIEEVASYPIHKARLDTIMNRCCIHVAHGFSQLMAIYLDEYQRFINKKQPAPVASDLNLNWPEQEVNVSAWMEKYQGQKSRMFFHAFLSTAGVAHFIRTRNPKEPHEPFDESTLERSFFDFLQHVGPTRAFQPPPHTSAPMKVSAAERLNLDPEAEARPSTEVGKASKSAQSNDHRWTFPDLDIHACETRFHDENEDARLSNIQKNGQDDQKLKVQRELIEFYQHEIDCCPASASGRSTPASTWWSGKFSSSKRKTMKVPMTTTANVAPLNEGSSSCSSWLNTYERLLEFLRPSSDHPPFVPDESLMIDIYVEILTLVQQDDKPGFLRNDLVECFDHWVRLNLESSQSKWTLATALIKMLVQENDLKSALKVFFRYHEYQCQVPDPHPLPLALQDFAPIVAQRNQVLVQRHYVVFGPGPLGLSLLCHHEGQGALVHHFESSRKSVLQDEDDPETPPLRPDDVLETANGTDIQHWNFKDIVTMLRRASRPMTLTVLRGLPTATVPKVLNDRECMSFASIGLDPPLPSKSAPTQPSRDVKDIHGVFNSLGIRISIVGDCPECGTRLTNGAIEGQWRRRTRTASDSNNQTESLSSEMTCDDCTTHFMAHICILIRPEFQESSSMTIVHYEYLSYGELEQQLARISLSSLSKLAGEHPDLFWNLMTKFISLDCSLDFLHLDRVLGYNGSKTPPRNNQIESEIEQRPELSLE